MPSTGWGGIGKSALATQAAHELTDAGAFPDGQLYVDLQAATPGLPPLDSLEALGRMLRALGLEPAQVPTETPEAAARFRSLVANRRLLVLLDNAATAQQVRPLLPASPTCGVVVAVQQSPGHILNGLPPVFARLFPTSRAQLDHLSVTDEGDSQLMLLRSPPRAPSASSLRLECRRLASIRELLPTGIDRGAITPTRRRQWAGMVRRLYAQALSRYPSDKRHTLLVAFLTARAEEVTDAIVEMFDAVIGWLLSRTDDELTEAKAEQAEAQIDSARVFRLVAEVLLDLSIPEDALREAVFRRVPRDDLGVLVAKATALDRSRVETFLSLLKERSPYVRAFVPDVLATLRFEAARPDDELLRAIGTLRTMGR